MNSDTDRKTGALLNAAIEHKDKDEQVKRLFEKLNTGMFSYFNRHRGLFSMENPITKSYTNRLVLNEVFVAEKDVAQTSCYRLTVDNKDMGKFKSSGLIIATGTGSSGWLYSARQITYHDVGTI